ncbi:hypothetical protein V7166_17545 [Bacillus thuringiensis]
MSIELGLLIGALSLAISYLAYSFNRSKAIKSDGQQDAEVRVTLGYIKQGVEGIQVDMKVNERRMAEFSERITRVEESAKQAHKRIDVVEKEGVNHGVNKSEY